MDTRFASEFLATGGSVTIELYHPRTQAIIALTDNTCVENEATGQYKWDTSKITTLPIPYQEYVYKMTDGVESRSGIVPFDDFLIQYIIHENMEI